MYCTMDFKKMKVEIVKFNEGEYAVRIIKGWFIKDVRYCDLINSQFKWHSYSKSFEDCIGSYEQAEKVYNRLMGGTVVK